jgi:hypothetical protein
MNDLTSYLAAFAAISAVVWGAIHGMQRLTGMNDRKVAITVGTIGAASGLLTHAVGFIHAPKSGIVAWVTAGFFGLLAAFAGAGATDLNLAKATITKGE